MALKRNIIYTFFTQFPVILLKFLAGVIITRLIGAEGKGIYTIFTANTELLALFLSLSANTGITYFLSTESIAKSKVIGLTFYTFLFSAIIGVLIVFLPMSYEELLFPEGYDSIIFKLYLLISFVFTISNNLFSGIFQGYKLYSVINKTTIINAVLSVIIFGALILTDVANIFKSPLNNVLFYSLVIYILNTLIWLWYYIRLIKLPPSLNIAIRTDAYDFYKYIGLGHISNVLNYFNYRLDIWFVNSYHGLEQLGLYSLAVNVSQILLIASVPITQVLFPYLSEEKERLKKLKLAAFFSRVNTFCLVLGLLAMYFTGEYFIPIVYGEEFSGSVFAFDIMLFAALFRGLTRIFSIFHASENKVIYNLVATIIGFVATVVFNIVLIPKYGIIGAAISSLVTYFAIFAFVYYMTLVKGKGLKLGYFIPIKADFHQLIRILKYGKK
ncbi:MAG: oligosaccharide flippase family protein [Flavobacteriales bacterium]|nr:oligosaccharide flippase family protein [Flavobacteriales bacterium]